MGSQLLDEEALSKSTSSRVGGWISAAIRPKQGVEVDASRSLAEGGRAVRVGFPYAA